MPPEAATESSHLGTHPLPVREAPFGSRAPGPGAAPPSISVVASLLADGPRTHRQLVDASGLPPRTVRWAVRRLRDEGRVDQRFSLTDGRVSWFFFRDADTQPVRVRTL